MLQIETAFLLKSLFKEQIKLQINFYSVTFISYNINLIVFGIINIAGLSDDLAVHNNRK